LRRRFRRRRDGCMRRSSLGHHRIPLWASRGARRRRQPLRPVRLVRSRGGKQRRNGRLSSVKTHGVICQDTPTCPWLTHSAGRSGCIAPGKIEAEISVELTGQRAVARNKKRQPGNRAGPYRSDLQSKYRSILACERG
jgi:hypothetical protein